MSLLSFSYLYLQTFRSTILKKLFSRISFEFHLCRYLALGFLSLLGGFNTFFKIEMLEFPLWLEKAIKPHIFIHFHVTCVYYIRNFLLAF